MASITLSTLPPEIHVSIVELCENSDLISFCLTSKWVNETCLHVLYRHVDLLSDPYDTFCSDRERRQASAVLLMRQQNFVHTLLSHPEYGEHVRSLKGTLVIPRSEEDCCVGADMKTMDGWLHAMGSLTHAQSVHIASRDISYNSIAVPVNRFSDFVLQSATSVRLIGLMQFGLAKSILNAVNPATLEHFCLEMVQERSRMVSGAGFEDGKLRTLCGMDDLDRPLYSTQDFDIATRRTISRPQLLRGYGGNILR